MVREEAQTENILLCVYIHKFCKFFLKKYLTLPFCTYNNTKHVLMQAAAARVTPVSAILEWPLGHSSALWHLRPGRGGGWLPSSHTTASTAHSLKWGALSGFLNVVFLEWSHCHTEEFVMASQW